MAEDDSRCPGSGAPAPLDTIVEAGSSWTGVCPRCGDRLELGYAGILPGHATAADADDEGP